MDLLVVDFDLNGSHRASALVVGIAHLQPGRTRWLFYSAGVVTQLIGHNLMLAIAFLYVKTGELRNRGADENIFAGNHRLSSFKEAEPSGRTF